MTTDTTPATDTDPDTTPATDTDETPDEAPDTDTEPVVGSDFGRRWVAHSDLELEHRYWRNPRSHTGLSDTELGTLADSIRNGTTTDEHGTYAGIMIPLEVVKVKTNGGFINLVIDGQRRHRAVALGIEHADDIKLPVVDLEPEPIEFTPEVASRYLMRALQSVGQRAGLSSYELVDNATKLRGSKNPDTGKEYTLAEIGRAIGKSESWVSKMLSAWNSATPKLLHNWKLGEITDENFKDAASVRTDRQAEVADRAVLERRSGNKGAARTIAKESKLIEQQSKLIEQRSQKPAKSAPPAKESEKSEKAKSKSDGKPEKRVVRGPQGDLPGVTAPPPATRKPTPFAVLEDFLGMTERKPPTHDYMRGLVDGVRWAAGLKDPATFGKPWHVYMHHAQGGAAKPGAKVKGAGKGKGKPGKKR